ncbi:MAG: response regulator, partial [Campylobacterota bacterium]|nr:response regulator [Campylobacterota bacterium]
KEEDSKVRIINNMKTTEYQVTLAKIEDEESYILTFTDITAIHDALYMEEHTKLPIKKFILEKIELLKQKVSSLNVILMSVNHFNSVEKWYGKKDAINVEIGFSKSIKSIRDSYMPNAFIGYFEKNQFIIIPADGNFEKFYEKLKAINLSSMNLIKKHEDSDIEIELSVSIMSETFDTKKELSKIEADLSNAFNMM